MKWSFFRNRRLSLANKLYGGYFIIVLLILIMLTMIYYNINRMNASYNELIERHAAVVLHMDEIQLHAVQLNSSFRDYLYNTNKEALKQIDLSSSTIMSEAEAAIAQLGNNGDTEKLAAMQQLIGQYGDKVEELQGLEADKRISFANSRVFPLAKLIQTEARKLSEGYKQIMNDGVAVNESSTKRTNVLIAAGSIFLIVATTLIGIVLSRNIANPVSKLSAMAAEVAKGDLRMKDLRISNTDEIGQLAAAFVRMREQLQTMISSVKDTADQLARRANDMELGAKHSSNATHHIVDSIQQLVVAADSHHMGSQQISTSMRDIAKGIQLITGSAQVMSETAYQTLASVENGYSVLNKTNTEMDSIDRIVDETSAFIHNLGHNTTKISQIVQLISSVASQTNLLALNAAIEAARAGEHGRGFAVVAEEVRHLAVQSEQASLEVAKAMKAIHKDAVQAAEMIQQGRSEVKNGKASLEVTNEHFGFIKQAVIEVTGRIQDVTGSSEQITAGTRQVVDSTVQSAELAHESVAMTQNVSAATEQQLASLEEIAVSSAALRALSSELQQQIEQFIVD